MGPHTQRLHFCILPRRLNRCLRGLLNRARGFSKDFQAPDQTPPLDDFQAIFI